MVKGPSKEQIAELKDMGYTVHAISDQDPCVYGWLNIRSGASQANVREKQPYRLRADQAWDDCYAYAFCSLPDVANPDWTTHLTLP